MGRPVPRISENKVSVGQGGSGYPKGSPTGPGKRRVLGGKSAFHAAPAEQVGEEEAKSWGTGGQ